MTTPGQYPSFKVHQDDLPVGQSETIEPKPTAPVRHTLLYKILVGWHAVYALVVLTIACSLFSDFWNIYNKLEMGMNLAIPAILAIGVIVGVFYADYRLLSYLDKHRRVRLLALWGVGFSLFGPCLMKIPIIYASYAPLGMLIQQYK